MSNVGEGFFRLNIDYIFSEDCLIDCGILAIPMRCAELPHFMCLCPCGRCSMVCCHGIFVIGRCLKAARVNCVHKRTAKMRLTKIML